jgi:hypothetical protein
MKVATLRHSSAGGWTFDGPAVEDPQLIIWFTCYDGATPEPYDALRALFPKALVAGCTTNGEIYRGEVMDGGSVAAAIRFESTKVKAAFRRLEAGADARAAGRALAAELKGEGLKAVFALADAFSFNGSDLVNGLSSALPPDVVLSGGMAGDDGALGRATRAGLDCNPCDGGVVAIGFYGSALRVSNGVAGGWEPLGPSRRITRAQGQVCYELDGQPALDVYEAFVGNAGTTARLRHPFCIKPSADSEQDVIWEVVGVDRENKGLVFIDAVPEGSWAQVMRGADENLVKGAAEAARIATADGSGSGADSLGLVVSCIGRKWVMGQRVGDETEAVQETTDAAPTIGFFSYGEVAPHAKTGVCTLHHASISVTMLSEAA